MATIKSISDILTVAKICSYLSFNDRTTKNFMKGGFIDYRLPLMIGAERLCVQWRYDVNPVDSTLRGNANYLFDLLGIYGKQAQSRLNSLNLNPPIVIGVDDITVNVGEDAVFSIEVISDLPYTIKWYKGGVLIPGETGLTYTLHNAQLSDNDMAYRAIVTNEAGSVASHKGILTVTNVITGYFTYSPTVDFYPILLTNSDPFTYGTSYTITHNANITVPLPLSMPIDQYMLVKVPVGESVKTAWTNQGLNFGNIPDSVFKPIVQFGGYTYYASNGQVTMTPANNLILS